MIGVLAAAERPDLFERLVLVGPSPRYVDDDDYRGGFSRGEIDELLETMDGNYLGWSRHIAPVIMGSARAARSWGRSSRPASAGPIPPSPATSPAPRSSPTTARTCAGRHAGPGRPVSRRRDRAVEVGAYVHEHLRGSELALLDATGHCPNLSAPGAADRGHRPYLATA